jgi:hypothetical protein
VLNNISKFFPRRQWAIPMIGLLLAVSVVGEQTRPVLSNEIETVPTSTALMELQQNSSETSILLRLRQIREQRSQLQAATSDSDTTEGFQSGEVSLNTQQRSRLVSSATLSKNVKIVPKATTLVNGTQLAAKESAVTPRVNLPAQDGIYLYGQSPSPNQLGQGYVLFHKQQGRVTGALYMPQSEFSCFQGTLEQSGELAMTVTGSPDAGGSTEVATANKLPTLPQDEPITYAYSVALQDYHQINSISASDRRILQMCNESPSVEYRKLVK